MTKYIRKKNRNKAPVFREGEIYAIIYARVSSDKQAIEGNGLDSQVQRCREYVNKKGYILLEDHVFRDAASGKGSYTTRLGQVGVFDLADKYPHRKYVLIVDDTSRLARDLNGHFEFRNLLKLRGVGIESPNFQFSEEPEGIAMEGVIAVMNQFQREGNRRQVIQKQKARLMNGYWPFRPKAGYSSIPDSTHGGKLSVPDDKGIKFLKPVLEGFADGTYVKKIDACEALVKSGFWEKQRPEKYIDKFTAILTNPFYAGDIYYPDWEVPRHRGKHEALISYETFDRIQKRLENGDRVKRIRRDTSPDFPLRGLLDCKCCGRNLTAAWTNKKRGHYGYYYCQNPECDCYGKMCKMQDVEEGFKEVLEKSRLKPEVGKLVEAVFADAWEEEMSSLKTAERLKARAISELEERERGFAEAAVEAKTEAVKRSFENQLEKVSEELVSLKAETSLSTIDTSIPYKIAIGKAVQLVESPYSVWEILDVREKHQLFWLLFEKKLAYSKKDGYWNTKNTATAVLFAEFALANPRDVEVWRVELQSENDNESESTTHSTG